MDMTKYHLENQIAASSSLKMNNFERMAFNFDESFSKDELINNIKSNFNDPYKKYNYKFIDNYHITDHVPNEFLESNREDWPIEYKFNQDFFRCDNFKGDHDGLHIVFSGCSNTEGIGSNIEDTWSHMLYSDISKSMKTSGYFNLAKGGSGTQTIVSGFMLYVKKYGIPDVLVVLHPNILRNYKWNSDRKVWNFDQEHPVGSDDPNFGRYRDLYLNQVLNWAFEWNLFLNYCKIIGTKVLWSTWDPEETKNIVTLDLFPDSFITLPPISKELIAKECPDGICPKNMTDARDGHPGKIFHKNVYNLFWNELVKRGIVND
jgi:hypothetical protein